MKVYNVIEDVLIATGIAISLTDIQQVLSIIILCMNVVWILVKVGIKIYQHYKEKNIQAIVDDIKTGADELEKLNNQVGSKNENKDGK